MERQRTREETPGRKKPLTKETTKHLTEESEERQRTVGAKSTNKTGRLNEKKNTERGRE